MDSSDLDQVIERYHRALGAFMTGDAEPALSFYSQDQDVTLANPFGPVARGQAEVRAAATRAATNYREGSAVGFDRMSSHASADLAYIVEVERYQAKVGRDDAVVPLALRVTSIFRREHGAWKLVHRHADPIVRERAAESVVR